MDSLGCWGCGLAEGVGRCNSLQGCNIVDMTWDVEYTDEFGLWWDSLLGSQQEDTAAVVQLLTEAGQIWVFPILLRLRALDMIICGS